MLNDRSDANVRREKFLTRRAITLLYSILSTTKKKTTNSCEMRIHVYLLLDRRKKQQ